MSWFFKSWRPAEKKSMGEKKVYESVVWYPAVKKSMGEKVMRPAQGSSSKMENVLDLEAAAPGPAAPDVPSARSQAPATQPAGGEKCFA